MNTHLNILQQYQRHKKLISFYPRTFDLACLWKKYILSILSALSYGLRENRIMISLFGFLSIASISIFRSFCSPFPPSSSFPLSSSSSYKELQDYNYSPTHIKQSPTGWPLNKLPQNRCIIKTDKKRTPFLDIINH